jgi:hypothetical protein
VTIRKDIINTKPVVSSLMINTPLSTIPATPLLLVVLLLLSFFSPSLTMGQTIEAATLLKLTPEEQQQQIPQIRGTSGITDSTNNNANTTTGIVGAANNTQAMTLEAARQQYLALWNQTDFGIAFNTYIEPNSATGYGIYEEHDGGNIFRPGEAIELYVEPVGFGHQQILDDNGNTLYLVNHTADIIIADINGNEVGRIEDEPLFNLVSHRQNTEVDWTLTVTQEEESFPVGDYIITYIVHDQVKGESSQIEKKITIAATDDNATTETVQEDQ